MSSPPSVRRKGWRYLATRLNGDGTEALIDPDLPIEDVTIEDVLSGDASISGTIEPVYTRLKGPDGSPILRPWATAIYAESDGEIRAGGILTEPDFDGPSLSLECVGFTGYGRGLPYTGAGYYGVQVDPLVVVREIWSHIQSQRGGNIGLELSNLTTPVKIGTQLTQPEYDSEDGAATYQSDAAKLNWYDTHDLMARVDDLASQGPFDYHERHAWDGDTIRHYLDFGYPSIGRVRNDVRFVFGVNIFEPPQVTQSGEIYATGTLVLGSGTGPSMIHSIYEPARNPGDGLRRIAVVEDSTISSSTAATARAAAETQWRKRLDDLDTVIVRDHPNAPLGSVQVGDTITVEAREDWIDTSITARVLSISYQPANGKVAEYTIARTDKLTS